MGSLSDQAFLRGTEQTKSRKDNRLILLYKGLKGV